MFRARSDLAKRVVLTLMLATSLASMVLIFASKKKKKKELKPLKQNVLTVKTEHLSLLVQPNTEPDFLGKLNITINFHKLNIH